jgi:hypothetical protein
MIAPTRPVSHSARELREQNQIIQRVASNSADLCEMAVFERMLRFDETFKHLVEQWLENCENGFCKCCILGQKKRKALRLSAAVQRILARPYHPLEGLRLPPHGPPLLEGDTSPRWPANAGPLLAMTHPRMERQREMGRDGGTGEINRHRRAGVEIARGQAPAQGQQGAGGRRPERRPAPRAESESGPASTNSAQFSPGRAGTHAKHNSHATSGMNLSSLG